MLTAFLSGDDYDDGEDAFVPYDIVGLGLPDALAAELSDMTMNIVRYVDTVVAACEPEGRCRYYIKMTHHAGMSTPADERAKTRRLSDHRVTPRLIADEDCDFCRRGSDDVQRFRVQVHENGGIDLRRFLRLHGPAIFGTTLAYSAWKGNCTALLRDVVTRMVKECRVEHDDFFEANVVVSGSGPSITQMSVVDFEESSDIPEDDRDNDDDDIERYVAVVETVLDEMQARVRLLSSPMRWWKRELPAMKLTAADVFFAHTSRAWRHVRISAGADLHLVVQEFAKCLEAPHSVAVLAVATDGWGAQPLMHPWPTSDWCALLFRWNGVALHGICTPVRICGKLDPGEYAEVNPEYKTFEWCCVVHADETRPLPPQLCASENAGSLAQSRLCLFFIRGLPTDSSVVATERTLNHAPGHALVSMCLMGSAQETTETPVYEDGTWQIPSSAIVHGVCTASGFNVMLCSSSVESESQGHPSLVFPPSTLHR